MSIDKITPAWEMDPLPPVVQYEETDGSAPANVCEHGWYKENCAHCNPVKPRKLAAKKTKHVSQL